MDRAPPSEPPAAPASRSSTERPEPVATDWLVVWLLVGAGVAAAFQIGKVPVALPQLRAGLDLGLVAAGWVISMFNVLGAFGGALVGAASDTVGHRRAVLGGLVVIAAASLAGAAAPNATVLLVTRFFEGLGFIATVTAAPGLIVRVARRADQRLAFGYWSGYMPAGTALVMIAAAPILDRFGWRGLWLANTAAMLLVAAAIAAATRRLGRPAPPRRWLAHVLADILRTLRRPGPLALALAFGSYTFQFLAVLAFLPTLLVEGDGMSPAAAASLTALAIAVNLVGNIGGGWLLHRGVARWVLVAAASLTMGLASLVIYASALPFAARYGATLLFSAVGGLLPAAVLGGVAVHAPSPSLVGTTTGLVMQGSNLGQSLGPPALAALAAATGSWSGSPAPLLAAAALGIGLAVLLRRLEG